MTTSKIQFYLDENVDGDVARGLHTRSIDALTTAEAGNRGMSDEEHLAYALRENRVIITQDSDFLVLHHRQIEHAGIVYYKPQTRSVKQLLRSLLLIYELFSPDDMRNHVEFL
jgi:predicted nuclease of predicted toxin-antitoxin system